MTRTSTITFGTLPFQNIEEAFPSASQFELWDYSNFRLSPKTQRLLAVAVDLAKVYSHAQVYPVHVAFILMEDEYFGMDQSTPLLVSEIQKAGGFPVAVKWGLHRLITQLDIPQTDFAKVQISRPMLGVLNEAKKAQGEGWEIGPRDILKAFLNDRSLAMTDILSRLVASKKGTSLLDAMKQGM